MPNSIAARAHILPNMELKAVNSVEITDSDSLKFHLLNKVNSDRIIITVTPFNTNQREDKLLDLRSLNVKLNKKDPILSLGIRLYDNNSLQVNSTLAKVEEGSAANKAGLQEGDKITKVNNQPITHWISFAKIIQNNPNKPLVLEVERSGSLLSLLLIPDSRLVNNNVEGFAGILPTVTYLNNKYVIMRKYGLLIATIKATNKIWQLTKLTLKILGKLIIGDVKINNIGGPISIAHGVKISANLGLVYYLMFIALISVNLGIINLLPIPVLDGGQLLFLIIEKFMGQSISERVQNISYHIGSIILALLMGIAFFNDFSRL